MSDAIEKKAPPLAFLLECSDVEVSTFELARLAEVANLRADMLALFDRIVDQSALAVLAAWLRNVDRPELTRQLLQSPNAKLEEILAQAREAVRNQGRSQEEKDGAMPSPWGLVRQKKYLTDEERRAGRTVIERQSREKHIAEGKCERCTESLDRNSVRYCTKHLEELRQKDARYRQKKGIKPGRGRQPGTLTALAASRDKVSLNLLAEWGIKPKHAAVSLNAAVEALQKNMPRSKAAALTQTELFEKAGIFTKTTGQRALEKLLSAGEIERIGMGIGGDPYRYWDKKVGGAE